MKVVGYRRADFIAKDGSEVRGYNLYMESYDIDPRYGAGIQVDRIYLSEGKLKREGLDIAELIGKTIRVLYNKYGKPESIVVED